MEEMRIIMDKIYKNVYEYQTRIHDDKEFQINYKPPILRNQLNDPNLQR